MKPIQEYIVKESKACDNFTIEDWMLLGAIVDDLRGDMKRNLEQIRQKEDLKALYDKINAVYKELKNKQ